MQVALVDAGFFIGRRGRHWGPRGVLTRLHRKLQNGKASHKQFMGMQKKCIFNDMKYLEYRMRSVGYFPSKKQPVIICWDGDKGRQFRGAIYDQYKANRAKGVENYDASTYVINDFRAYLAGLDINPDEIRYNWISIHDDSLEADDLIASQLMKLTEIKEYDKIWVFSADSDCHQFFTWDDRIHIHNFVEEIKQEDVVAHLDIPLEYYTDWKAICGDTSDNIPGIPKIGPKKAGEWIRKYGGIDTIPPALFKFAEPKNIEKISQLLSDWRKDNDATLISCTNDIGRSWGDFEKQKSRRITHSEYELLCERVPECQLEFKVINYLPYVKDYKRMIKLPFDPSP